MGAEEREQFVASLENALDGIPVIARARVGRRRVLGRAYDAAAAEHYEFAAVLEFAAEADLRTYLDHPAHLELGRRFFASAETMLVHDFEMVDGSAVRSLLDVSPGGTSS